MSHFGQAACALVVTMLVSALAAHAEKRVALVIGNSAYVHTDPLANPKNDAVDMAAVLRKLEFHVIDRFDLDKASFDRTIKDFAAMLVGADMSLFFYAGHGLQAAGQNYLVPIDAELKTAAALDFEMVRLDLVQRSMERETQTNVLFFDACRDNPLLRNLARALGTRSMDIGRGFAAVESGAGTLISYSTQPGNVASDGSGRNSPYTGALVKHIVSTTDDLFAVLISVRNDVMSATSKRQVPWTNEALTKRIYLNRVAKPSLEQAKGDAAPHSKREITEAAQEWSRIDKTNSAELGAFLRRHGHSPEADYARARLRELLEQKVKPPSQKANTKADEKASVKVTSSNRYTCCVQNLVARGMSSAEVNPWCRENASDPRVDWCALHREFLKK
jgi:uncharacterized caspase-like protein